MILLFHKHDNIRNFSMGPWQVQMAGPSTARHHQTSDCQEAIAGPISNDTSAVSDILYRCNFNPISDMYTILILVSSTNLLQECRSWREHRIHWLNAKRNLRRHFCVPVCSGCPLKRSISISSRHNSVSSMWAHALWCGPIFCAG